MAEEATELPYFASWDDLIAQFGPSVLIAKPVDQTGVVEDLGSLFGGAVRQLVPAANPDGTPTPESVRLLGIKDGLLDNQKTDESGAESDVEVLNDGLPKNGIPSDSASQLSQPSQSRKESSTKPKTDQKKADSAAGKPISQKAADRARVKEQVAIKKDEQTRITNLRLHAVIVNDPYEFGVGTRNNTAKWETIHQELIKRDLLEDTPAARHALHKQVSKLLTVYRTKYLVKRTGDEPPPEDDMTDTDKLVRDIYTLKESGETVRVSATNDKKSGASTRESVALIGMTKGNRIRDYKDSDDEDENSENGDNPSDTSTRSGSRFNKSVSNLDCASEDNASPSGGEKPKSDAGVDRKKRKMKAEDPPAICRTSRNQNMVQALNCIAASFDKTNALQAAAWKEERIEMALDRKQSDERFQKELASRDKDREAESIKYLATLQAMKEVIAGLTKPVNGSPIIGNPVVDGG